MKDQLSFLAAGLSLLSLVACSSMATDEPDNNLRSLPADFNDSIYVVLNPDLRLFQIRDAVEARNAQMRGEFADSVAIVVRNALDGLTMAEVEQDLALPDSRDTNATAPFSTIKAVLPLGADNQPIAYTLNLWLAGASSLEEALEPIGSAHFNEVIQKADQDLFFVGALVKGTRQKFIDSVATVVRNAVQNLSESDVEQDLLLPDSRDPNATEPFSVVKAVLPLGPDNLPLTSPLVSWIAGEVSLEDALPQIGAIHYDHFILNIAAGNSYGGGLSAADSIWQVVLGNTDSSMVDDFITGEPVSIITAIRNQVQAYNILNYEHDVQFALNFEPNYRLTSMQYQAYGQYEGRPYRYCASASELGTPIDQITPVLVPVGTTNPIEVKDYSANLFCYNQADSTTYSIKQ